MQGKRTNLTRVIFAKIYRHGLSPVIFAIALFFGLLAVNYIIAVKSPEFDVTRNKVNSLSQETTTLLKQINFNVTVKAFYLASNQRRISQILEKYSQRNERIKVEFIDPIKIRWPRNSTRSPCRAPSCSRPRERNPHQSERLGRYHGEREITIALYRLITENTKKIYFTTGHGELALANAKPNGISTVLDRLEEQNYIVESLNLVEKNGVPKDCNLLLIAGPSLQFNMDELKMVASYMDNAGSVFLMLGPGKTTGLEPAVESFGILLGKDYVYETSRSMTTQAGGPIAPLCAARDTSEITDKLANQSFIFPYVRSMTPYIRMDKIMLRRLVASSENSWAETDLKSAETLNTGVKPSRDEKELKGPITVATIAEREYDLPDSLATRANPTFKVRSAFFGNASFISNEVVTMFPSNMNLFLNTVNWITKNEKIIEITPHTVTFTPVELKDSDRRIISWFSVVLIPFAILMAGIVVWYRRR